MAAAGSEPEEVARLRALLFGAEARRLRLTETRVGALEAWIGNAPRLESAVARVLVDALRRSEAERGPELARALAAALQAEIAPSDLAPVPEEAGDDAEPFVDLAAPRRRLRSPAFWTGIGLAAALAGVVLWFLPIGHAKKTADIEAALREAKNADPRLAAYPLSVSADWGARTVELRGLAPSRESIHRLVRALTPAVAPLALTTRVEAIGATEPLQAELDRTAKLAGALVEREAQMTAIAGRLERVEQAAAALRGELSATTESVARAHAAEVGAMRAEIDKADEAARLAAESAKAQGAQIMLLAAGFDGLRAQIDRHPQADGDTPAPAVAAAKNLRLGSEQAAKSLAAAAAGAGDVARRIDDALAHIAAPNEVTAALREAKTQADGIQSMLRAEADDARRRADGAAALERALASPVGQ